MARHSLGVVVMPLPDFVTVFRRHIEWSWQYDPQFRKEWRRYMKANAISRMCLPLLDGDGLLSQRQFERRERERTPLPTDVHHDPKRRPGQ
jgi:hypothetical protein